MKTHNVLLLLLALGACSTPEPIPSASFDGVYRGTREVNDTRLCGVATPTGRTSATVHHGHMVMPLYGPQTRLEGAVDANGYVRASGMWANPTGGYPGMTVLTGRIEDGVLEGRATDYRCDSVVRLSRYAHPEPLPVPPRPPHHVRPRHVPPHHHHKKPRPIS